MVINQDVIIMRKKQIQLSNRVLLENLLVPLIVTGGKIIIIDETIKILISVVRPEN